MKRVIRTFWIAGGVTGWLVVGLVVVAVVYG